MTQGAPRDSVTGILEIGPEPLQSITGGALLTPHRSHSDPLSPMGIGGVRLALGARVYAASSL